MQYDKSTCFASPLDYETLLCHAEVLCDTYESVSLSYIGNSLLSRKIPMLCFGEGEGRSVFYIAGHHASEWLCGCVLLHFLYDIAECEKNFKTVYGINPYYIRKNRKIYVVPSLNVDGIEIQIHAVSDENPLKDRILRANGGEDFTHWQANARGVDLNHNYNAGFEQYKRLELEAGIVGSASTRYSGEYPESEPEVSAVCNFLRYTAPSLILTLHSQGEEIFGGNITKVKNGLRLGRRISDMTSYKLCEADGFAAYGGLSDWYTDEMRLPSFTLECGKGENPLPLSDGEGIYARLRRALFTLPATV